MPDGASSQSRLTAALTGILIPGIAPEIQLTHRWLHSWTGIGLLAVGLQRQGWDLGRDLSGFPRLRLGWSRHSVKGQ